jgi:hypothetical protein
VASIRVCANDSAGRPCMQVYKISSCQLLCAEKDNSLIIHPMRPHQSLLTSLRRNAHQQQVMSANAGSLSTTSDEGVPVLRTFQLHARAVTGRATNMPMSPSLPLQSALSASRLQLRRTIHLQLAHMNSSEDGVSYVHIPVAEPSCAR